MDVKIGIVQSAQVVEVEIDDEVDRDKLKKQIGEVLGSASKTATSVLWLTDRKGKDIVVPADRISYVEVGSSEVERRIGFGA